MTNSLATDLAAFGNLAPVHRLVDIGHSRTGIRRAIASGTFLRPCRGWVATASASQLAVTAVVRGGKLTSATALASMGVWDGMSPYVHINIAPHGHAIERPALTPIDAFAVAKYPRTGGYRFSWSTERAPIATKRVWRTSLVDALLQASRDLPDEQFIASVDSALNTAQLTPLGFAELRDLLPAMKARLLTMTDASAGSGLETIARLRLKPIARSVQTQFVLPGIGRAGGDGAVDFLLDGWLVIEVDGDAWHDRNSDSVRDAKLVRMGYRALHFTFDQVINRWAEVEATIRECLQHPPRR